MEKIVEVDITPKEIAQKLFEMDETEVAQVFEEWHNVFEENLKQKRKEKYQGFTHDLGGFLYYLIPALSENGKDIFRLGYAYLFKNNLDDNCHKWLM